MSSKKNIAIVVARYGREVLGGAELHGRLLAEHLLKYYNVKVLTTKAKDHVTWRDEYKNNFEQLNNITVERFSVDFPRNIDTFVQFENKLFSTSHHSVSDEERWIKLNGPYSSKLLHHLQIHEEDFDLIIFIGYLSALTYFGAKNVFKKAIIVPTLHDERQAYLKIYKELFRRLRGVVVSTPEELNLMKRLYSNNNVPSAIIGVGLEEETSSNKSTLKKKFKNTNHYFLFMGRIEAGKGAYELFDFFQRYKQNNYNNLNLLLVGKSISSIPDNKSIKYLGYVDSKIKSNLIKNSIFVINPSFFESLSLVVLEAWAQKKPVLVNGRCNVLKGQVERSQSGLWYYSYEDFEGAVNWLIDHEKEAKIMGMNGKKYLDLNYSWPVVEKKFRAFIDNLL